MADKPNHHIFITSEFQYELACGENPYQTPASLFATPDNEPLAISNFTRVSGEPPCYTNVADADSLIHTLCLAAEAFRKSRNRVPYIAVAGKHGNACGMGVNWNDPSLALEQALLGNPRAIWGGEFIASFTIDEHVANQLFQSSQRRQLFGNPHWMLDVVMAAEFSPQAIDILGKSPRRKLLQNNALSSPYISSSPWFYRQIRGGILRQPQYNYIMDLKQAEIEGATFDEETFESLVIAWAVAWSSNHGGNEIAIAKDRQLLSVGGGPSTLEAAQTAVMRASSSSSDPTGGVFAADAFFPFTDACETLTAAGLKAGLVPAGGKREAEVRYFLRSHGLSVAYLPQEFRGFCRH